MISDLITDIVITTCVNKVLVDGYVDDSDFELDCHMLRRLL
jgi:hypothetical protein